MKSSQNRMSHFGHYGPCSLWNPGSLSSLLDLCSYMNHCFPLLDLCVQVTAVTSAVADNSRHAHCSCSGFVDSRGSGFNQPLLSVCVTWSSIQLERGPGKHSCMKYAKTPNSIALHNRFCSCAWFQVAGIWKVSAFADNASWHDITMTQKALLQRDPCSEWDLRREILFLWGRT